VGVAEQNLRISREKRTFCIPKASLACASGIGNQCRVLFVPAEKGPDSTGNV